MIPDNLERIHIEKALAEIDQNGVQNGEQSTTYDLIHNAKRYPPKLVLSLANKYANGNELDRLSFTGGENTKAFKLLRNHGFHIESKTSIKDLVQEFLEQAKTSNLKTKHYPSKYRGLDISISFGAGNSARIPWIAFLKPPNKVMDGIYPGLLFYKEHNLLILTYGKSETNSSSFTWNVSNAETIGEFFKRKFEAKPDRYGSSLVKAIFKVEKDIDFIKFQYQLDELIDQYKSIHFESNTLGEPTEDYKKEKQDIGRKYWIYSPGENAEFWDEFYQKGVMGLGWDYLGDLRNFNSKEEIRSKLQELEETDNSKKNDATACDDFLNNIQVGDIVIAKKGRSTLIGYGKVVSDYYFDKERKTFQKQRKVEWKKKGEWNAGLFLVLKTLTDITRYPSKLSEYDNYYEHLLAIMDEIIAEPKKELGLPLNCILYGPPGTGKTYKTKEIAVKIGNPDFDVPPNYNDLKKRKMIVDEYDRLFQEGQIVFTTFHQSFSYEDFVEGIKPKTTDDKKVIYDISPGIFKRICERAKDNWLEYSSGESVDLSFDEAFRNLKDEWEENENLKFPLKTEGKDYKIIGFTDSSIQFKKASGGTSHTLSISTLRDAYYRKREIKSTGVGIYYPGILNKLKTYGSRTIGINRPSLEKFVLVIDEINRGNVSGIFGELITLLEEDKRLGENEEIIVELPYSKEPFSVPPNVYIIGTMNTADRSVESLDTALRRRFAFEEVMPLPELLENIEFEQFNLSHLLKVINGRIEALLDRDHTIGHSYFIGIQSGDAVALRLAFENKIIPLLQEYFYHDYEKIALILGEGFIEHRESNVRFANFNKVDQPEINSSFELKKIEDIEDAVHFLLN
ncbi:AAA family ATPase [Gillisia sp. M10.2A]|uniref:AAA family ATPase n=1 Tax=Gillisia lutea TaxID=2909668 RepID=A0ABS9EDS0_9FLAO|nr:AAA family ATPase [Gillisia lutea]MCF4101037.1 AAA family ATPase [Gillisia lutea]